MEGWLGAIPAYNLHFCIGWQPLCKIGELAATFCGDRKNSALLDCLSAFSNHFMAYLRIADQHFFWPVPLFQELFATHVEQNKQAALIGKFIT